MSRASVLNRGLFVKDTAAFADLVNFYLLGQKILFKTHVPYAVR